MDFEPFLKKERNIAVVGLGYVGMPLLAHLSKKFATIGFDISPKRIEELSKGIDSTGEVDADEFIHNSIEFSCEPSVLRKASVIIVAVPTPIDNHKLPDLEPLKRASAMVGENLSPGSVVVYESTVYPGATEEICVPILEKHSGLRFCKDFHVGYSPERINPGDRVHTVDRITKVVSACCRQTVDLLAKVYGSINQNNIFIARDIKTAEAAKVIENTQRDLNIALMNELSMIFNRLGLDTKAVLDAAKTKWNFLPFEPGLVGGHCIGVDPYYLTYKAQEVGHHPEVILAGRRINDSMGEYVAYQTLKRIIESGRVVLGMKALVLGITFKENIGDIRNTRVVDTIKELKAFGIDVDIHDPYADANEVKKLYNLKLKTDSELNQSYPCVIVAVKHDRYMNNKRWIIERVEKNGVLIDIKSIFDKNQVRDDIVYWRL